MVSGALKAHPAIRDVYAQAYHLPTFRMFTWQVALFVVRRFIVLLIIGDVDEFHCIFGALVPTPSASEVHASQT